MCSNKWVALFFLIFYAVTLFLTLKGNMYAMDFMAIGMFSEAAIATWQAFRKK